MIMLLKGKQEKISEKGSTGRRFFFKYQYPQVKISEKESIGRRFFFKYQYPQVKIITTMCFHRKEINYLASNLLVSI